MTQTNNWFTVLLTVLFATSLVTSNVIASKLVSFTMPLIGMVTVPAGFVGIALAFLFSDSLAYLYGESYTRKVVNASIAGIILLLGLVYVAVLLPPAPFYEQNQAFESILLASAPISIASVTTLLVSQNLDVSVFSFLRTKTDRKWVWNIGSTVVSQLVDTSLFIVLGFYVLPQIIGGTVTPLSVVWSLIVAQYAVKVCVALLDTPVFYAITHVIE